MRNRNIRKCSYLTKSFPRNFNLTVIQFLLVLHHRPKNGFIWFEHAITNQRFLSDKRFHICAYHLVDDDVVRNNEMLKTHIFARFK